MARIAVLHNALDFQGGADAVCLVACEALLDAGHDVTLVTLSETSPETLATRFDVDVAGLTVQTPPGAATVAQTLGRASPWTGPLVAGRSLLIERYFRRHARAFDVALSTTNELSLPVPSVQYVHYPQFRVDPAASSRGRMRRAWGRLAGPTGTALGDATLLANSEWTAAVVERTYGVRATVVHPPVTPVGSGRPWTDRVDGVLTVGRIAPDKRVHEAFSALDRVRARGHDLSLTVVGSAPRAYRQYAARVEAMASRRPYATVECDVGRDRLTTLLRSHKYGLNLKPDEHFGMSVAEYVSAGMVAFAPASGGQQEVLDGRRDRLFTSLDEAVDLIDTAVSADHRPSLPRDRFGRETFQTAVRDHVTARLEPATLE